MPVQSIDRQNISEIVFEQLMALISSRELRQQKNRSDFLWIWKIPLHDDAGVFFDRG